MAISRKLRLVVGVADAGVVMAAVIMEVIEVIAAAPVRSSRRFMMTTVHHLYVRLRRLRGRLLRPLLRLSIALVDYSQNKPAAKKVNLNGPKGADAERLVSAGRVDDDAAFELKLRPNKLNEFIGQSKAKEQLAIALEAARSRGEALDHVLLFGPPGLGKTTLATIIANELGVGFQQTSGPALQIQGDLTAILTNIRDKQVLFLDEIHRLQPVLEEKLYTALEDYKLDIIIGQGPAARTHVMEIKPFTFVAATTRPGLLSSPLRSRFGILLRLEFYTDDELRFIVERSADVLGVPIDQDGAAEIAMRSRGTPSTSAERSTIMRRSSSV